ncbi:MAG: hypothetical protein HYY86_01835 [Candidatus Harrisonbacteria bacterium]|nr:hypothetical protein [Candidatus Harrisonbacteria bacterium]
MTQTEIILKKLRHKVLVTAELIDDIIPGYQKTYKAMRRVMHGYTYPEKLNKKQIERLQEKSFFALLSRLKKQGFIKKQKIKGLSHWQITKNGIQKLEKIKIFKTAYFPKRLYAPHKDSALNLIIFDIPERLKYKRIWLRKQLKLLAFEMLQKSVWAGEYKIPEDFLFDIEKLELTSYIHIFRVIKKGSLN